jgi:hypothetical protein
MSDYKVVTARTTDNLRNDVVLNLDLDWEIVGPVQIQPNTERKHEFWYFQTMILK